MFIPRSVDGHAATIAGWGLERTISGLIVPRAGTFQRYNWTWLEDSATLCLQLVAGDGAVAPTLITNGDPLETPVNGQREVGGALSDLVHVLPVAETDDGTTRTREQEDAPALSPRGAPGIAVLDARYRPESAGGFALDDTQKRLQALGLVETPEGLFALGSLFTTARRLGSYGAEAQSGRDPGAILHTAMFSAAWDRPATSADSITGPSAIFGDGLSLLSEAPPRAVMPLRFANAGRVEAEAFLLGGEVAYGYLVPYSTAKKRPIGARELQGLPLPELQWGARWAVAVPLPDMGGRRDGAPDDGTTRERGKRRPPPPPPPNPPPLPPPVPPPPGGRGGRKPDDEPEDPIGGEPPPLEPRDPEDFIEFNPGGLPIGVEIIPLEPKDGSAQSRPITGTKNGAEHVGGGQLGGGGTVKNGSPAAGTTTKGAQLQDPAHPVLPCPTTDPRTSRIGAEPTGQRQELVPQPTYLPPGPQGEWRPDNRYGEGKRNFAQELKDAIVDGVFVGRGDERKPLGGYDGNPGLAWVSHPNGTGAVIRVPEIGEPVSAFDYARFVALIGGALTSPLPSPDAIGAAVEVWPYLREVERRMNAMMDLLDAAFIGARFNHYAGNIGVVSTNQNGNGVAENTIGSHTMDAKPTEGVASGLNALQAVTGKRRGQVVSRPAQDVRRHLHGRVTAGLTDAAMLELTKLLSGGATDLSPFIKAGNGYQVTHYGAQVIPRIATTGSPHGVDLTQDGFVNINGSPYWITGGVLYPLFQTGGSGGGSSSGIALATIDAYPSVGTDGNLALSSDQQLYFPPWGGARLQCSLGYATTASDNLHDSGGTFHTLSSYLYITSDPPTNAAGGSNVVALTSPIIVLPADFGSWQDTAIEIEWSVAATLVSADAIDFGTAIFGTPDGDELEDQLFTTDSTASGTSHADYDNVASYSAADMNTGSDGLSSFQWGPGDNLRLYMSFGWAPNYEVFSAAIGRVRLHYNRA